jgi:predicted secreted protein
MSAIAGRKALVKVSTTESSGYTTVKGIKSVSVTENGAQIDVSEFGDSWKNNLRGLLDAQISLQGNLDPTDTTGQSVIRDAFLNDTPLFMQVLWDGTNGVQMQVQVTKWQADAGVEKEVSLAIDASQTGGVTLVP